MAFVFDGPTPGCSHWTDEGEFVLPFPLFPAPPKRPFYLRPVFQDPADWVFEEPAPLPQLAHPKWARVGEYISPEFPPPPPPMDCPAPFPKARPWSFFKKAAWAGLTHAQAVKDLRQQKKGERQRFRLRMEAQARLKMNFFAEDTSFAREVEGLTTPLLRQDEELVPRGAFAPFPSVKRERREKAYGPVGSAARARAEARIDACLKKKLRLASYQAEWREARALRSEKMERACVVLCEEAHHVVSFKAATLAAFGIEMAWPNRAFEKYFQKNNSFKEYVKNLNQELIDDPIIGQMDNETKKPQGDQTDITSEQKSNVDLVTSVGESKALPLPVPKQDNQFRCMSAPRSKISENTFTDRWFTIKTAQWKKIDLTDTKLFDLHLPKDFLEAPNAKNSPNFVPFANHTYWRGNMKIKVMVNSNARQYGQLQIRFYYGADLDENYSLRDNIYVGSQQPHCLVTASSSNVGELTIPFEYIFPVLRIRPNKPGSYENSVLGNLIGRVLVPLNMNDATQSYCTYSIAIAFENSEFCGMVDTSLIEGQMFSVAGSMAVVALAETFLDNNRDNPTVTLAGQSVYPQNTGSWCIGNGINEWSNVLRLDPNSVLPYPPTRVPNVDEMTTQYIYNIYGLFKIVDWSEQHLSGSKLFDFDAAPLLEMEQYPTKTWKKVDVRVIPPVGVLSSLYAYWRGSLELRIDVVGCVELTGRLLVAYVPRVKTNITFNQAINCSHAIFDLQNNRQFVFEIPFVSDMLFWPRYRNISEEYPQISPPGRVFIFVYNDLVANSTIPTKCELCLYIRGGKDFEVSVPASPSLALSFEPNILISKSSIIKAWPKEGYCPMYISTWHTWQATVGVTKSTVLPPIFRYGNVTDHIVQFSYEGDILNKVLKSSDALQNNHFVMTSQWANTAVPTEVISLDWVVIINYIVLVQMGQYVYAVPFDDIVSAKAFASAALKTAFTWLRSFAAGHTKFPFSGANYKFLVNNQDKGFDVKASGWISPSCPIFVPAVSDEIVGQGEDERKKNSAAISRPQESACTVSASKIVFGEQFKDLKDYCRRYHRYASGVVKLQGSDFPEEFQMVILKFPSMPQGLSLDIGTSTSIKEYWNRAREGPIPLIASGYRFFTGGLRFRIVLHVDVVEGNRPHNMKISVQHRPNVSSGKLAVEITSASLLGTDDLELPGYATHIQHDDMNSIVSVEIPYYLPSVRGLLQRPSDTREAHLYSSLGEIAVGIQVDSKENSRLVYDIYYSLSDDARFSVFQGFPPMIDITKIPNIKPSSLAEVGSSCSSFADLSVEDEEDDPIEGQMEFFRKVKKTLDITSSEGAKDLINNINDISDKVKETLNTENIVENTKFKLSKYVDIAINAITNIAHCLINPNIKTVVIAVVSFFSQLKLVTLDCVAKLVDKCFSLFQWLLRRESTKPNEDTIEGQMDDDTVVGYVSTLIAGAASSLSAVGNLSSLTMKNLGSTLLHGLKDFAMTANCLFRFLQNNVKCLTDLGHKLFNKQPSIADISFLEEHENQLHDWASEVIKLTDPLKEDELFSNMKSAQRVFVCANQSCIFQLRLLKLNMHLNSQQQKIVDKLTVNIIKLRDRLVKRHISPPVRFEPYCYEIAGPSGLGKSHLLQLLPYKLMESIKMKVIGRLIYDRAQGNRYWNGVRNELFINYDDRWSVLGPEFCDVQLSEIFQLKTRGTFNPPQAAIEDKERCINPICVQSGTNVPFPKLNNILCPEAVYRRRDDLIEIRRHPSFVKEFGVDYNVNSLKKAYLQKYKKHLDLNKFPHIQFRFARNPADPRTTWGGWVSFMLFEEALCQKFKSYYLEESKKYEMFCEQAMSLYPTEIDVVMAENHFTQWVDSVEKTIAEVPPEDLVFRTRVREDYKAAKHESVAALASRLKASLVAVFSDEGKASTSGYVPLRDVDIPINLNPFGDTDDEDEVAIDSLGGDAEIPFGQMGEVHTLKDEKTPICPHVFLREQMLKNSCEIDWISEEESWFIDTALFANNYPNNSWAVFAGDFVEGRYEGRSGIRIPNAACSKSSCYQSCLHLCTAERRITVFKYINVRQSLRLRLENGGDLTHMFPKEVFDGIKLNTPEKIKEEIGWFKGTWTKIKDTVMSWPWKKFFTVLKWLALLLFPISLLFINYCTDQVGERQLQRTRVMINEVDAFRTKWDFEKLKNATAEIAGQGHVSGDYKVQAFKGKSKSLDKKEIEVPEGQMSEDQFKSISKLLRRNTFYLFTHNDENSVGGRCLGICGTNALLVDHYWESFCNFRKDNPTAKLFLVNSLSNTALPLDWNLLTYSKYANSSLGLLKLPGVPPFKDLRSQIATHKYHSYVNGNGSVFEMDFDDDFKSLIKIHQVYFRLKGKISANGVSGSVVKYSSFDTGSCYEYDFTGKGKCGSVLLANNLPSPILGVHVAGTSKLGYCESIYREMFEHLTEPSSAPIEGEGEESRWYIPTQVFALGKVKSKLAHRENEKSRIVPSEVQIYSDFPIYTDVAVLSPNDSRIADNSFSPMLEGCAYHGLPPLNFNQEHLILVFNDMKCMLNSSNRPMRPQVGVLSVDEACGGIPYLDGYDSLEWRTSEGFPFAGMRPSGQKDKKWLFNISEDNIYESVGPLLARVLEQKHQQRLNGTIPSTVFTDCLKDCTVEKEKVLKPGKTRVFSMAPVDFTIQQRQYTMDFAVAYMANRLNLEHAVGINPDSVEWTKLAEALLDNGDKLVTGDFSKFGDRIPFQIIELIFKLIIEWYKFNGATEPEIEQILSIMSFEIGNCIHLMFNFLYQTLCGQPSGNSLTVIFNSLANSFYFRLAWLHIMQNTNYSGLDHYRKFVKLFSYGDDVIMSVADEVPEFNAVALCEFFALHEIKFTNEDKSDDIVPFVSLNEAKFLKRGFKLHPKTNRSALNLMLAPLKVESIEDTINWVWNSSFGRAEDGCATFREMCLQVCEDATRNAFGRGPEYYEYFTGKLQKFWQSRQVYVNYCTWDQLDKRVFDLQENINIFTNKKKFPN